MVIKCGNFYFPYLYSDDEFIVENTIDVPITGKNAEAVDFALERKDSLYLTGIAKAVWSSIKEYAGKGIKDYNSCWFVPNMLHKLGKEYVCSVDILRKKV